jgi:hypothetical protein
MFTEHSNSTVLVWYILEMELVTLLMSDLAHQWWNTQTVKPSDSRIAFNTPLLRQWILSIKQRYLTSRKEVCCRYSFLCYSMCTVIYIQRVVKKCKYVLSRAMKAYKGSTVRAPLILSPGITEKWLVRHNSRTPGNTVSTHWIEGWVDWTSWIMEKFLTPLYNDYTNPAPCGVLC